MLKRLETDRKWFLSYGRNRKVAESMQMDFGRNQNYAESNFFRHKPETERSHVAVMNHEVVHSVIYSSQNPADRPANAFTH